MLPSLRIRQPDRFELKYVLSRDQSEAMVAELKNYMILDQRGDAYGRYLITSLYFDTVDYKAYWDKVEGHRFRRKVRVRVYGRETVTPETLCFAEIKQRINKTLQKKRVLLPYTTAMSLGEAGEQVSCESEEDQAVVDEILYLRHTLQLQPACVVSYHRLAFEGSEHEPGLRVTFDSELKGRVHDLSLLSLGYTENQYFMSPQQYVMEVKANSRVPHWLTQLIGNYRCTLRRVSKYCTALEQAKLNLGRQQISY